MEWDQLFPGSAFSNYDNLIKTVLLGENPFVKGV